MKEGGGGQKSLTRRCGGLNLAALVSQRGRLKNTAPIKQLQLGSFNEMIILGGTVPNFDQLLAKVVQICSRNQTPLFSCLTTDDM